MKRKGRGKRGKGGKGREERRGLFQLKFLFTPLRVWEPVSVAACSI